MSDARPMPEIYRTIVECRSDITILPSKSIKSQYPVKVACFVFEESGKLPAFKLNISLGYFESKQMFELL